MTVALKKQAEPKRFSGRIKLYWQELGHKDDIIIEVHDQQTYAALEVLHGLQHLEGYERWQNHPEFEAFTTDIWMKCEAYIDRIKKLRRLHTEKWDWDWAE